jgi:hypothetical protein
LPWLNPRSCLLKFSRLLILKVFLQVSLFLATIHQLVILSLPMSSRKLHLLLCVARSNFSTGLPSNIFKNTTTFFLSDFIPCPSWSFRFKRPYYIRQTLKLQSSSLWSLLHSPFLSLFDSNTRLIILFSNILSLIPPPNLRDHVTQNWQYYCFIYFYFQIIQKNSRRQNIFGYNNNMKFLL